MHDSTFKSILLTLASTSLLAACGGGGSSPSTSESASSSVPKTETQVVAPTNLATLITGVFDGSDSDGQALTTILQNDGSYFMVLGNPLKSAVVGTGSLNNSSFASSNGVDLSNIVNGAPTKNPVVLSASYSLKQSFNGSISYTANGQSKTFVSTYNKSFESLPPLASLVGSYSGSIVTNGISETGVNLTISADGSLRGNLTCGCVINAALAPRDDKLAYVATLAMTGGDHPLKGKSIAGNVYLDVAQKRLYIVGTLIGSNESAIYVGNKL